MVNRRKLIWQLYPSFLLLALFALAVTGWYASKTMRSFYLDQTRENLIHQALIISRQLTSFMNPPDTVAIDRFCKEIGTTVPIRLTILQTDGVVLGDSKADPTQMENHGDRPEIRQALDQKIFGSALRFSATLDREMMYVAVPFDNQGYGGVVRVSVALTAVEKQLRGLTLRLVIGGIIIALLTSLVCLIISKRISRPIEAMRQGAERFARGELTHRLDPPNTEELAVLTRAMNQMAEELEQRIEAIISQGKESETVLSSMMEGVVALDREERITQFNSAAARLINGGTTLLRGASIQEVIRHTRIHEMVQATLQRGETNEDDIVIHNQTEQIFHIRCTPLVGVGGRHSGVLLVISDVTRLRRLEIIRQDFAANVSHEVKTPLTAIKGFVQTLLQGAVSDPDEIKRFLRIINKHVNRLTAIVDDLMQLSRLEQDETGTRLSMQSRDIHELLASAVALCRNDAEVKDIKVQTDLEPGLTAAVDVALMEQAAVNLLDNAIKYSPQGSQIHLSAYSEKDQVVIRFEDNGSGIEEKHLPRIFERFYRVDKSRSRQMGGTGLGLAIVKHIVQAHGGSVSVQSSLGKGSVFTILLPKSL